MDFRSVIKDGLLRSADVKRQAAESEELVTSLLDVAEVIVASVRNGGKILFCGNGGSAADSQHLATELVVRLTGDFERPAIASIALTTDTSILTGGANDYGYDHVFKRQIEALGREGDVLIAISTSGKSPSVLAAMAVARVKNMKTVAWCGADPRGMEPLADYIVSVPSNITANIQECHITLGHLLIHLVERMLYPKSE
ncbi:MAG: D-sedoheptulose 7-phosphate isomerase [bacterium]|nr:D-sedoheptulose 7-phosphate isomerase [bacterium]